MSNFIDDYMQYTEGTEPPAIYHRWCALTTVSAMLGRHYYFQHGHFRVFPNLYVMLIGESGARKSTSIRMVKKVARKTQYPIENYAAEKTSKEKFLMDLAGMGDGEEQRDGSIKYDNTMAENLWGTEVIAGEPRETFVVADEFNDFIGLNNIEFCSNLGTLWDWDDDEAPYKSRLKNSKSVSIFQPTITILGGNTQENFALAFPQSIIGQGFLARMILIHGEKSGRKITFPEEPDPETTKRLAAFLQDIRSKIAGAAKVEADAAKFLDEIYQTHKDADDIRLRSYSNKRFAQLLKLTLICSSSEERTTITTDDILRANTYLAAAERLMPKALGEFGKSKTSDVANKVLTIIDNSLKPLTAKEIWRFVYKDLNKITDLNDVMQSLITAEKVQLITGKGYLPRKAVTTDPVHVNWDLLTKEEQEML